MSEHPSIVSRYSTRAAEANRTLMHGGYDYWPVVLCIDDVKFGGVSVNAAVSAHDLSSRRVYYNWLERIFNPFQSVITSETDQQERRRLIGELILRYLGSGPNQWLTDVQEQVVVNLLNEVGKSNQGLAPFQIRQKARRIKEAMTGKAAKVPGKRWLVGFMLRHQGAIRAQQVRKTTESARAKAEQDIKAIEDFYADLVQTYKDYGIVSPSQVYAYDETGISSAPRKRTSDVVIVSEQVPKGSVKRIDERQKDFHTSIIHFCRADGKTLAPMAKMEGRRIFRDVLEGAMDGMTIQMQDKGYFVSDDLVEVLKHVELCTENEVMPEGTKEHEIDVGIKIGEVNGVPVPHHIHRKSFFKVVLSDGCASHASTEAKVLGPKLGILAKTYPPHLTHCIQPSDTFFFGPMKNQLNAKKKEMFEEGVELSKHNLLRVVSECWKEAAKEDRTEHAFLKLFLSPLNIDATGRKFIATLPQYKEVERVPLVLNTELQIRAMGESLGAKQTENRVAQKELRAAISQVEEKDSTIERLKALLASKGVAQDEIELSLQDEQECELTDSEGDEEEEPEEQVSSAPFSWPSVMEEAQNLHPTPKSLFPSPSSTPEKAPSNSYLSPKRLPYANAFVNHEQLTRTVKEANAEAKKMQELATAQKHNADITSYAKFLEEVRLENEAKAKEKSTKKASQKTSKAASKVTAAEAPKEAEASPQEKKKGTGRKRKAAASSDDTSASKRSG